MPPLLKVCRGLILSSLALVFPCGLLGQSLAPEGGEKPVLSSLPGDQTMAHLALGPNGGYLVWRDNGIDKDGSGIAALRVSGNSLTLSNRFRVNLQYVGEQERPQVALLTNGGAVFVWQGGRQGFPNVYARFANRDGRFVTSDLQVNPVSSTVTKVISTNLFSWRNNRLASRRYSIKRVVSQVREVNNSPTVVGLADGNAAIVYAGFRKTRTTTQELSDQLTIRGLTITTNSVLTPVTTFEDTMQDVFLQRLSATGKKLGGEVLVNQFTTYNQRDPASALLKNGNLVVVWVSEKQVAGSQLQQTVVEIAGRIFDAQGQPLSDEFRVNTENRPCAAPAVSGFGDGSFVVVWSQMDGARTNGWDVYGRAFPAAAPAGNAFRVNSYARGDQFAPRISGAGMNQLVVWTSVGQDGSRAGVYGQFLSGGETFGSEFRVNTRTVNRQWHPTVASNGRDRFLTVWSSFVGLAGFDLTAQGYRTVQPLASLPPPVVTALSQDSLNVAWPAAPYNNVLHYELYADGSSSPTIVTQANWVASGLATASTHEFRLAAVLTDGQRTPLSSPASGRTLDKKDSDYTPGAEPGAAPPPIVEQFRPGSVPLDSTSVARLGIQLTQRGKQLTWKTRPGAIYQVQTSTNLTTWRDLGALQSTANASDSLTVTNREGAAFYRVIRVR